MPVPPPYAPAIGCVKKSESCLVFVTVTGNAPEFRAGEIVVFLSPYQIATPTVLVGGSKGYLFNHSYPDA